MKTEPVKKKKKKEKKLHRMTCMGPQIVWKILSDGNWVMMSNGCEKLGDDVKRVWKIEWWVMSDKWWVMSYESWVMSDGNWVMKNGLPNRL